MTVVITNRLLASVNIEVNGSVVGTVQAGQPWQYSVGTTSTLKVGWTLNRRTTSTGTPIGDQMGGTFDTVNNPSGKYEYTIDNKLKDAVYFIPMITNNTDVGLLMAVNEGLQSANRCNCVIPARGQNVQIGYYQLFSNSNVKAYREGSNYSGPSLQWTYGNQFTADNLESGSGRLLLKVDSPPASSTSSTGGGGSGGGGGGTSSPTVTTPNTMFIASQDYEVSDPRAWWVNDFTVNSTTRFVLRFASQYKAQAAIFASDKVEGFKSHSAVSGLYVSFDSAIGTKSVTLGPGSYYVGVRNTATSGNKWSIELDQDITLPATDRSTFVDVYIQGAKAFSSSRKLWHPFTIQNGYRYFLDGCNVGFKTYIIPADQLDAFKSGQSFKHYTDYEGTNGGSPGLYEIKLPAGNYYFVGNGTGACSIVYTMERWRVN